MDSFRLPNCSKNSILLPKSLADRKFNSAHSSCVLFCRGVPVNSTQWSRWYSRRDTASLPSAFFNRCASSTMMHCQGMAASTPFRRS